MFKLRLFLLIIKSLALIGCGIYIYFLKKDLQIMTQKYKMLSYQNSELSVKLNTCSDENKKLAKELRLNELKYKKKINELIKKINKKPKYVYIPKEIEVKNISCNCSEYKKMVKMINNFEKIIKEN